MNMDLTLFWSRAAEQNSNHSGLILLLALRMLGILSVVPLVLMSVFRFYSASSDETRVNANKTRVIFLLHVHKSLMTQSES